MPRPRRAVIRAAVAQNRPVGRMAGVGPGHPVRRSNGPGGQRGTQGPNNAGMASQATPQAPTAMPWDSLSTAQGGMAERNYGNSLAGIASNEDFERRRIGLGAGYENNPYSQASLLQRQREIGNRGTINRAGNQLYAGATVNRLGGVERGYNEGRYNLEQSLAAKEAGWNQQRQEAEAKQQEAQLAAQEGALERAANEAPAPAPVGGGQQQQQRKRRKNKKGK